MICVVQIFVRDLQEKIYQNIHSFECFWCSKTFPSGKRWRRLVTRLPVGMQSKDGETMPHGVPILSRETHDVPWWKQWGSHGQCQGMVISTRGIHMGMGQNLVPLVNPKIASKWMFIPLKIVLIGIDPYPYTQRIVKDSSCGMTTPDWSHVTWPWYSSDPCNI